METEIIEFSEQCLNESWDMREILLSKGSVKLLEYLNNDGDDASLGTLYELLKMSIMVNAAPSFVLPAIRRSGIVLSASTEDIMKCLEKLPWYRQHPV